MQSKTEPTSIATSNSTSDYFDSSTVSIGPRSRIRAPGLRVGLFILIASCGCRGLVGDIESELASPATLWSVGFQWSERDCDARGRCLVVSYRVASREPDRFRSGAGEHGGLADRFVGRPLYRVEYATSREPGTWRNACGEAARGLFVSGSWTADGSYRRDGFTFSCLDGVIAKCVRSWGYDPDRTAIARDGSQVPLRDLHLACVRAARADYCGDGVSHTRDGTPIVMTDQLGISRGHAGPEYRPEACFDRHGALWVSHTRWPIGESAIGDSMQLPDCRLPNSLPGRSTDPGTVVCVASDPTLGGGVNDIGRRPRTSRDHVDLP
ncbi:MAG: hypothetical protein MJE77_27130 [Proteobacteria bacterium]|nr:hypothetical protein [Pseudomonadota bacterium]